MPLLLSTSTLSTSTRSTQPCIPPGSLNQVPASAGGKGGNVTSAGWQVTLCDPIWHVSSRSGVATLRTAIHLLLTSLSIMLLIFLWSQFYEICITSQNTHAANNSKVTNENTKSCQGDCRLVNDVFAARRRACHWSCLWRHTTSYQVKSPASSKFWPGCLTWLFVYGRSYIACTDSILCKQMSAEDDSYTCFYVWGYHLLTSTSYWLF